MLCPARAQVRNGGLRSHIALRGESASPASSPEAASPAGLGRHGLAAGLVMRAARARQPSRIACQRQQMSPSPPPPLRSQLQRRTKPDAGGAGGRAPHARQPSAAAAALRLPHRPSLMDRTDAMQALQTTTAEVVALAPGVAAAAAARWLEALLHDLKGRLAALRRSRKRVVRAIADLQQPPLSEEDGAGSALLLLQQLDSALGGEGSLLEARLLECSRARHGCGVPMPAALKAEMGLSGVAEPTAERRAAACVAASAALLAAAAPILSAAHGAPSSSAHAVRPDLMLTGALGLG